ncbi:MAG: hypothetical protein WA996_26260 [Candidatus Promineifilaceae bacterium]
MIKRLSYRPDLILLLLSILFVACKTEPEIPKVVPSVVAPTSPPPTDTRLPTPTPTATVVIETETPTQTPTSTATPVIPGIDETPSAQSGINITSPKEHEELIQGAEVSVGGLSQLGEGESLTVTLVSATGQTLAVADVVGHPFNNWDGKMIIPVMHSGSASVLAKVLDSDANVIAQDTQEVVLGVNPEITDVYLDLFRPQGGDGVVAGFNMFFDGWAQRPVDNRVSISLWNESCLVQIARQSFILRGSGYWQGFLIIPAGVSGPACAVAHFGESGDDAYRQAQIVIDVLPVDDDQAIGVLVGNPPADSDITPGSTLLLYGSSYNAPEDEISVTIHSEDGRLITEGVASADSFGYWELSLFIPSEATGIAEVAAIIGDNSDGTYAEHRVIVHIGARE